MDNILTLSERDQIPATPVGAPDPIEGGAPASGPADNPYQGAGTSTQGAPGIVTPGAATRISHYPETLVRGDSWVTEPEDNLLAAVFRPTAPGTLRIGGAVTSASTFTVSLDGGQTWLSLNGGTNLADNAWFEGAITVTRDDQVAVSVSAQTTVQAFRAVFVPDMV